MAATFGLTMNRMTTPYGELELDRYPTARDVTLRAWDAADEYLLTHLAELPAAAGGTTVVVNDRWGALATALAGRMPFSMSDSYLAHTATTLNLERNGRDAAAAQLLSSLDELPERIDLLLVRVPKTLALLEHQLHRLAPHVHAGTVVVGAGMVKEIHTSTLDLFGQLLGPTRTSLATKKARLIFTTPDVDLVRPDNPWPRSYPLPSGLGAASGLTVAQHAGVFSAERLDIGTRFLVQNLPKRSGHEQVIDLGCGNGVIGLAAALSNPDAEVTFVDESYLAVAAAAANFRTHLGPDRLAHFRVGDGLQSMATGDPIARGSVDLILNNPPFHLHVSRTDETAWRMFVESRAALRLGGELWVVGNQTLGYHAKFKRLFGNYETVASNAKFVVVRAVRT